MRDELQNLEVALLKAEHPLAYSWMRPPGRPETETRAAALSLLGCELPEELLQLWEWWHGTSANGASLWPREAYSSMPSGGAALPGGVAIESLEYAVETMQWRRASGLYPTGGAAWLPVIRLGDTPLWLWAELDNVNSKGEVPLTYTEGGIEPVEHRFSSVRELIVEMTELLDSGEWSFHTAHDAWGYNGDGAFSWGAGR